MFPFWAFLSKNVFLLVLGEEKYVVCWCVHARIHMTPTCMLCVCGMLKEKYTKLNAGNGMMEVKEKHILECVVWLEISFLLFIDSLFCSPAILR